MCRELKLLFKKHNKWIKSVINMGCNPSYAEDIVQDAYIKINEALKKGTNIDYGDDDVNDFYFWNVLRSCYVNNYKSRKIEMVEFKTDEDMEWLLLNITKEGPDMEKEDAYMRLMKKIYREIREWDFYDKTLFIAYFSTSATLDKLRDDSLLGRHSVYNRLKKCMEHTREELGEDVEDYFNEDYNLIK